MNQHKNISLFINIYMILFCIGLLSLMMIDKGDMVIFINNHNSLNADVFFKYLTFIGDGILFVPLIIALLFVRYAYATMGAIIAVSHGLIISFLKRIVFKGSPRPTAYFEDISTFHFIEGVKVHTNNSFPSGHTATAFAFCLFLTFLINRKSWGIVLLSMALLGGYSRMYLLQHFYIDTVVGGLIGSLVTIITWKMINKRGNANWMNKKISLSK